MKKVTLTDEAKFDVFLVEDYLYHKYSLKVLFEFNENFDLALERLSYGNVIFQRYENTKYRKFLLTKHNTIIYEDTPKEIFVVKILQNFQDPEENYKSIMEE